MGYQGHRYEPSGPYVTKVSAVPLFSARSQIYFWWVLASTRVAPSTILLIFMDCMGGRRVSSFGDLRIASLLFADDVVLLASSNCDLQQTLEWFSAKCVDCPR